jgi:hypothetical protein
MIQRIDLISEKLCIFTSNNSIMKKYFVIASTLLVAGLIAAFTLAPATTIQKVKPAKSTGTAIPEDVYKILENSCMGCHANGANNMAAANVNFSVWDTYPVKKQAKKSSAVCKAIEDGSMPPAAYVKSNPTKAVTKEQAAVVCKWALSLNYK